MPDLRSRQPACEGSLLAGEPLWATAPRADVWLLLEHNANWGAKALPESALPEPVKTFFNAQVEAIPNARFQFIKRGVPAEHPRFYIAITRENNPSLYQFDLPLEDLLLLDIQSVVNESPNYDPYRSDEKLFLVCTNVKRDISCAKYGLPLYHRIRAHAGNAAWQTNHLGGHRFAGTLVCLPSGVYYGRVSPSEAVALLDTVHARAIDLPHLRGRCCYDAPTQAADYFIRQQYQLTDLDDLAFVGTETAGENGWTIRFASPEGLFTAQLHSRLSDFEIYESTTSAEKNRVNLYDLDALHHQPR